MKNATPGPATCRKCNKTLSGLTGGEGWALCVACDTKERAQRAVDRQIAELEDERAEIVAALVPAGRSVP